MKKIIRKLHLYLGLFTIPLGLMYAVTGIASISGISQTSGAEKQTYTINEKIEQGNELDFIIPWAEENNIELPSDLSVDKIYKTTVIGGVYYSINLLPKDNLTEITVSTRSIIGTMIMLHRAESRWYFNILGILLGISLISFYISGIVIASFSRNINGKKIIKKEYLIVIFIGFIVTISFGIVSI